MNMNMSPVTALALPRSFYYAAAAAAVFVASSGFGIYQDNKALASPGLRMPNSRSRTNRNEYSNSNSNSNNHNREILVTMGLDLDPSDNEDWDVELEDTEEVVKKTAEVKPFPFQFVSYEESVHGERTSLFSSNLASDRRMLEGTTGGQEQTDVSIEVDFMSLCKLCYVMNYELWTMN